ncbi:winged helix-turn-helix transcriptional regulator [Pseudonocardia sp. TRM90224]|uniref:winged helix-turn-helix transcriptional regulator n=1 Tax=Pseudonocardia sp. TRM90224 TaxID=2812678 RepID=UPI001E3C1910|nr:helix-turn-helix domain-containing protein [Pseudonocardia sp. TRM90224]
MDLTDSAFCPRYHRAVELIGKRWTGVVLRAMLLDVTRFADLRAVVPGLSDRMLAERLKELQDEGVVERIVHDETPVRIEYRLTQKGRELHDAVYALSRWADRWIPVEPVPVS